MSLDRAVEVFVKAFCLSKSRTYPYMASQVEGLWVLQDTPPRKNARKIEVISHELPPAEVVGRIERIGLGWHFLCDIQPSSDNFDEVRQTYKSLGYRALGREWFFEHDLQEVPEFESDPPVRLVRSKEEMDSIPQLARQPRQLLEQSRQFAVWDGTRDYGWVRSIPMGQDAWVSDLYVHSDVRGRGFGRALMSSLLRSDREHGVGKSVLLASSSGARLYPHLGYRQTGILQVFCPVERG